MIRVTAFPPESVTDLDASPLVELRVRRERRDECRSLLPAYADPFRLSRTTALSARW